MTTEHEQGDAILAALQGTGGPAGTVAEHAARCLGVDAAIVVDGNADEIIERLVAAGWTLDTRVDQLAGKRIRTVVPPAPVRGYPVGDSDSEGTD
jgi:hypothetical protein